MSDLIEFGLHDLPWEPIHSEMVEVLRYYDGPQAGIVRQHGASYLFQAIVDVPDGVGLWVYTWLHEDEVALLRSLEDPDQIDPSLYDLSDDRTGIVVAVSRGVVTAALSG